MIKKPLHQDMEKELIEITRQLLTESGELYKREIKLDVSLQRHLGIDSLGRAELFQRIEKKFKVTMPDRLLAEAETLNDIAKYLYAAKPEVRKQGAQHLTASLQGEQIDLDTSSVKTIIELLLFYAEHAPHKQHIYFQQEDGNEEVVTYGQLLNASLRVAFNLRERGLKEGETVAIMQPTNLGFFYTFLGTLLAGGIPVPIYPPFRLHMIETYAKTEARILINAEARVLVTFEQAETLSLLLKSFVPSLKHVVTVNELLQSQGTMAPFNAKADHFALIQYTSGSTALPKGVLLTHANLLSNIRAYGKAVQVSPEDITVSWLPLYHDMGLIGMWLGSLCFGTPLVLLTPFTFLNHPDRWLWAIHYHRGTLSGAPNFAYELCVRKIDPVLLEGLDLSSWRVAANGAEAIYPRTLEQFAKKFASYGFKRNALLPVYGLAEATVCLTIPPLHRDFRVDYIDRKKFEEEQQAVPITGIKAYAFVACGKPIEGHAIRIVDKEGKILPERYVGQLQFRGPSSMQGYYHRPDATQAIYHDGWLDSGDLAYMADEEVFITGRCKDIIIKTGRNLYPAEIEEVAGSVPGIRQGCVVAFGMADGERGTEQLMIVAETREKNKVVLAKIREAIKEAVAAQLDIVPDHVMLVRPHTVPKTSSGKLQRAACKAMYLEGRLGHFRMPAWLQVIKLTLQGAYRQAVFSMKMFGKLIYTLYLCIVLCITLLPLYILVYFGSSEFAAKTCRVWAKLIAMLALCPVQVVDKKQLNTAAPIIYAANHASYIDSVVMLAMVPPCTRFVGKKELLSVPIIRTFMKKLNYLAVDRMDLSKGIEDTKHIEQTLRKGKSILIFPEGTFGYASGLRPFRLGAFKIAAETNLPVCPIALQGTRFILRADEKLAWPGKIKVTLCDPIMPTGSEWQDVTRLRQAVRSEIAKYCGEPSLDFIAALTVAAKDGLP